MQDTQKTNLEELEIGTYTVTCKITSQSNKTATASKTVNITTLANEEVEDSNNKKQNAYAIYSEYDLAYFRDLVNIEEQFAINGKLMNDINLSNVCSSQEGSWTPIGEYNSTSSTTLEEVNIYYDGIFDGANKKIENLYINNSDLYRQGLFSVTKSNAVIKNLETYGEVNAKQAVAGIVSYSCGILDNCTNHINVTGSAANSAGITGTNNGGTINNCTNYGRIEGGYNVGGIVGRNNGSITNCMSIAEASIQGEYLVGGIAGINENSNTITDCYNLSSVTSTGASDFDEGKGLGAYTGGIVRT